jgi:hypothetical protein
MVAGCSGPTLADKAAPSPQAAAVSPPPAPPATPSTPAIEATPLLGGPKDEIVTSAVATMQPIANPEDMTPEERARIYGPTSPHHPRRHRLKGRHPGAKFAHIAKPSEHRAQRKINGARAESKAQPTKPSIKPRDAQSSPAAAKPTVAPKPRAPAPAAQTPKSTANKTGVGGFPQAVAGDVAAGLKLTIPPLRLAQPTVVTLNLPASMFEQLQTEARRHAMENAAKVISVQSTLSADQVDIRPMGPQSVTMGPDEATTFNWAVTPTVGGVAVFKTHIAIVFKGATTPQTVAVEFNTSAGTKPVGSDSSSTGSAPSSKDASSGPTTAQNAAAKTGLVVFGMLGLLLIVALAALSRRTKGRA